MPEEKDSLKAAGASGRVPARTAAEQQITAIWAGLLGLRTVGVNDNFFDLGGNSLMGLQVIARLKKEFQVQIPAVALFEAPTVSALARYLQPAGEEGEDRRKTELEERRRQARQKNQAIAVIGMAGRFPGAKSVEEFWENLRGGVESVARFSDEELLASGIDPALLADPNYVKARPVLTDVDLFDAALFGYTPREAELLDPQQRLFQECAWEALERAGYDAARYRGLVGVFAGANLSAYLVRLLADEEWARELGDSAVLGNDKDALTTNVSYKLNLRGPSVAVQTFCSTSLVAVHLACRSLRGGECDMALAGGVSIRVPVKSGYLYQEGDQVSHDGHCRTFDAGADGTMFGDGVGLVVLKRLEEAIADGDRIAAVIRGTAINNDGGLKVGYTAPSVVGQAEVVEAALLDAGVRAEEIDYVEAHGTATKLGDPIEVASLTRAFRKGTEKRGYCALGSVKPNVGHLDRAAGVTGLIKTVLSLEHGEIPATLHFERPNPEIDFDATPFYVNTRLRPWKSNGHQRCAGVNSLGVGGTNAHVVVEEAPPLRPSSPSRDWQLLVLSARSEAALDAAAGRLRAHLERHPEVSLADVAHTLQVGRRVMEYRHMMVCHGREDALALLGGEAPERVWTARKAAPPRVTLVLGGASPRAGELYERDAAYRAAIEHCSRILKRECRDADDSAGAFARATSVPFRYAMNPSSYFTRSFRPL